MYSRRRVTIETPRDQGADSSVEASRLKRSPDLLRERELSEGQTERGADSAPKVQAWVAESGREEVRGASKRHRTGRTEILLILLSTPSARCNETKYRSCDNDGLIIGHNVPTSI